MRIQLRDYYGDEKLSNYDVYNKKGEKVGYVVLSTSAVSWVSVVLDKKYVERIFAPWEVSHSWIPYGLVYISKAPSDNIESIRELINDAVGEFYRGH